MSREYTDDELQPAEERLLRKLLHDAYSDNEPTPEEMYAATLRRVYVPAGVAGPSMDSEKESTSPTPNSGYKIRIQKIVRAAAAAALAGLVILVVTIGFALLDNESVDTTLWSMAFTAASVAAGGTLFVKVVTSAALRSRGSGDPEGRSKSALHPYRLPILRRIQPTTEDYLRWLSRRAAVFVTLTMAPVVAVFSLLQKHYWYPLSLAAALQFIAAITPGLVSLFRHFNRGGNAVLSVHGDSDTWTDAYRHRGDVDNQHSMSNPALESTRLRRRGAFGRERNERQSVASPPPIPRQSKNRRHMPEMERGMSERERT